MMHGRKNIKLEGMGVWAAWLLHIRACGTCKFTQLWQRQLVWYEALTILFIIKNDKNFTSRHFLYKSGCASNVDKVPLTNSV